MSKGIIMQKIYTNSFFLRFHGGSRVGEIVFSDNPTYKEKKVSVVQVMMIEDGYFLAELVFDTQNTN